MIGGVIDQVKSTFKGIGNSAVDTLVRPSIQAKATEQIDEFKKDDLKTLPADIRKLLETTYASYEDATTAGKVEDLSKTKETPVTVLTKHFLKTLLKDKNEKKLDKFLNELVERLDPVIDELLTGVDIELTDYIVDEVKEFLRIIPKKEKVEPEEGMPRWPVIAKASADAPILDRLTSQVHKKIRHIMEKLLPKIMSVLPEIIKRVTTSVVNDEVKEALDVNTGIQFVDKLFDKAEEKTLKWQQNVIHDVCEFIWDGVDEQVAQQLIDGLTKVENELLKSFREAAEKLPGI